MRVICCVAYPEIAEDLAKKMVENNPEGVDGVLIC